MLKNKIVIFGYGNHGQFIAKGLLEDGFDVTIVESDKVFYEAAKKDEFTQVFLTDVTKDRELKKLDLKSFSQLVCVMDDEHLNVFLTLSLRSLFEKSYILSISDSLHTTQKLQMAGANKVIDLYEVSANKIHNILNRPIATKLLEEFVMYRNGIAFREMLIAKGSFLHGLQINELDLSVHGVLLVGMIDESLGHHFTFVTAGGNHKLNSGDTIVCIGEYKDLETFEKRINGGE